jgi:hypothetical protein
MRAYLTPLLVVAYPLVLRIHTEEYQYVSCTNTNLQTKKNLQT